MEKHIIKELVRLLDLLRDYILEDDDFEGMCMCTSLLHATGAITYQQERLLDRRIYRRAAQTDIIATPSGHFWKEGQKEPRLKFIKDYKEDLLKKLQDG